jgi:DNA replication protein
MILRDGIWEPEFGGTIPVADGTKADLQIELSEITDKEFARRITAKSSLRILDRGTTLRAYLTTKTLNGVSERGSTLITSNMPFDEWTETFGSERLTGALLDRLTHHVSILEMNGESYRLANSTARKRHQKS